MRIWQKYEDILKSVSEFALFSDGILKTIMVLVVLMTFSSCKPIPGKFLYISLEEIPGITVMQRGDAAMPTMLLDESIPISYRLVRSDYVLQFEVDTKVSLPTIFVRVSDEDRFHLVADNINRCAEVRPDYITRPVNFSYRWLCGSAEVVESRLILFKVVDSDGQVLGEESIPFRVKENGFYIDYDSM